MYLGSMRPRKRATMTTKSTPSAGNPAQQGTAPIDDNSRVGLAMLRHAYTCAQDAGSDLWDFALEIDTLYEAGLTISDSPLVGRQTVRRSRPGIVRLRWSASLLPPRRWLLLRAYNLCGPHTRRCRIRRPFLENIGRILATHSAHRDRVSCRRPDRGTRKRASGGP